MSWGAADRRRFPRVHYGCVVRVRHKGSAEAFQTTTENIGCGGVCVMLPKALDIYSPAELEIFLESDMHSISCDGRIVWCVRRAKIKNEGPEIYDTGVEFVKVKDEDRNRIEKIVEECCRKNPS